MATELVLIGDSVLDNASYVAAGESVTDHLRATLGTSAHVTLLARDGNVTSEARHSLRTLPRSATHLLVSSGGNDALWDAFLLNAAVPDIRTAFDLVGERVERFAEEYRMFLRTWRRRICPAPYVPSTTACRASAAPSGRPCRSTTTSSPKLPVTSEPASSTSATS